jgi:hypothetical protein
MASWAIKTEDQLRGKSSDRGSDNTILKGKNQKEEGAETSRKHYLYPLSLSLRVHALSETGIRRSIQTLSSGIRVKVGRRRRLEQW